MVRRGEGVQSFGGRAVPLSRRPMAAPPDVDYAAETEKLKGFLESYLEDDIDGQSQYKYLVILQQVANRRERQVHIDLDDVYEALGDEIGDRMRHNSKRYQNLLADAIDQTMPAPTVDQLEEDVADILLRSRMQQTREGNDAEATDGRQQVPKSLTRRFEVRLMPRVKEKAVPLRQVRANSIGNLLTVKGIVTRVSEVKPSIAVATYTCSKGGFEVYQEVSGRSFMPLFTCPAATCCAATGRLNLQTRGCRFVKFQEVKIQEEVRGNRHAAPHGPAARRARRRHPPSTLSPVSRFFCFRRRTRCRWVTCPGS